MKDSNEKSYFGLTLGIILLILFIKGIGYTDTTLDKSKEKDKYLQVNFMLEEIQKDPDLKLSKEDKAKLDSLQKSLEQIKDNKSEENLTTVTFKAKCIAYKELLQHNVLSLTEIGNYTKPQLDAMLEMYHYIGEK